MLVGHWVITYPLEINAKLKPGEQNRFNVRFVKHSSIAGRLLELNGGTDALKNFCRIYVDQTKKFKGGLLSRPAIVIVDNDKAGRDVVNYAKGIAKNQGLPYSRSQLCIYSSESLYVLRIQSPGNEPDCVIEQLFPDQLLSRQNWVLKS